MAALALAQTLYIMGRFQAALAAVPDANAPVAGAWRIQARTLRAWSLWLLDDTDAAQAAWQAMNDADAPVAARVRAECLYLTEAAESNPQTMADYQRGVEGQAGAHAAWARVLADWWHPARGPALSRLHGALGWLQRHAPAGSARAAAVFAEARFREAPAHALVWLDAALDQVERYGQHDLKARLLHKKVLALEAAGQLAEAGRFLTVARETAQRQGAWRYLRAMQTL